MSQILNAAGRPANEELTIVSPTGTPVTSDTPEKLPKKIVFEPLNEAGYVMMWTEHPKTPGTYALYVKSGQVVAVANSPDVASLLCEAMRLSFLASQQLKAEVSDGR